MTTIRAFFSDQQLQHEPKQFMRAGRLSTPTDVPARAQALIETLRRRGVPVDTPADAGLDPLLQVHEAGYLDFLSTAWDRWHAMPGAGIEVLPNVSPGIARSGPCPSPSIIAQAGWYVGDLASPIGAGTWPAVLRSAHSAVAAADHVLATGEPAYALCRPSGHHAQRSRACGFCYVNNSAVAASRLRQRHARVAVLDIDAHHGDGTQQIFYDRGDVLTVSMHADPSGYYPWFVGYAHERGTGAGEGANLNLPLPHGCDGARFGQALDAAIDAIEAFDPGAIVVPLGFDTYKDDPISVLQFDMDTYRMAGRRIGMLGLPTVVVQEGGYMVEAIGEALDAFLEGLVDGTPST